MDLLPETVVDKIFRDKHAMEYRPTLDMIEKFRYAQGMDDDLWYARQPIKELLRPVAKTRKYFYIDVEDYQGDMIFTEDIERVKKTEKKHNISVKLYKPEDLFDEDFQDILDESSFYTKARIKWQSTEPMRVIDLIVISKALDLNSLSRYYILEKIHTYRGQVSFEFT